MTTLPLSDAQRRAVEAPDTILQIIAGAGSGKTQVMASRVSALLQRPGTPPSSIVAFTFTEKAAAELKDRIYRIVEIEHDEVLGLADMFVGTMHAYCLNLLQTHLYRFLKFTVLSESQTRLFVNRFSTRSGLTSVPIQFGPSRGQHLQRYSDARLYIQVLDLLREADTAEHLVPAEAIAALESYRGLLREMRYLDYSEIILEAVRALEGTGGEDEPLRRHLAASLRHVIVDEYQDVNPLQERLIGALHALGAIISVVGDDDQTIYQWRGSDVQNILTFADRYENVQTEALGINYRSSPAIVEAGKRIAERNDPNRLPKELEAGSVQDFERGDLLALEFASPEEEARWIAEKVIELQGVPFVDGPDGEPRGLSWSDCAVLLRSVARNAEPIIDAFKQAQIPYVVVGLANLFETNEIWAVLQLFGYLVGASDRGEVEHAWLSAELGLTRGDLDAGVRVLDEQRHSWDDGSSSWAAYSLQRTYLRFLEAAKVREERVPGGPAGNRGEIVMFNLGKFSQVISDFEQVHFKSEPKSKYETFFRWLTRDAPVLYEEGGINDGYAQPDAVQVTTVHRAKGLEWPAVFIPALQRNRFPSARQGGRTVWHVVPREAVSGAHRYEGSLEDEVRLFYVAITRSQKYLFCTFAPGDSKRYRRPSELFTAMTDMSSVLTRDNRSREWRTGELPQTPRSRAPDVVLSFSELKYMFECPYQFKIRFLYGFNSPIHEALGFGKSLHDALAEIHKRALDGEIATEDDIERLVDEHLHLPFAYPSLDEELRSAAVGALERYLTNHGASLWNTMHAEQTVELTVAPGITVNGRIDLIRRLDTDEVSIVDFKSSERAQAEDVTRAQLHVYALGYEQLTGDRPDLVEVLNLDPIGRSTREIVDSPFLETTRDAVAEAGEALRANVLPRLPEWCDTCAACDFVAVCRTRPRT
jgi:DNA helicase II / ATP-dependent DNA helicase PcrA